MRQRTPLFALIIVALLPAAATADEHKNGKQFNGKQFNGKQFNGQVFGDAIFTAGNIDGVDVSGGQADLSLVGSKLTGRFKGAKCDQIVGATYPACNSASPPLYCSWARYSMCAFDAFDLEGATLSVKTDTGQRVTLRFDAVEVAPDPTPKWRWVFDAGNLVKKNISKNENEDVITYDVSYKRGGYFEYVDGMFMYVPVSWHKLCDFEDTRALAVAGQWKGGVCDEGCGGKVADDGFELACRVGAIAKCVEIGFKPWKQTEEDVCIVEGEDTGCGPVSMSGYHQACVRMIRSDVCGNGQSLTKDGTLIDIDSSDLNPSVAFETTTEMDFEAEWYPDGAVCVSRTRWNYGVLAPGAFTTGEYINENCGERWIWHGDECGDPERWDAFHGRTPVTYIMNKTTAFRPVVLDPTP